MNAFEYFLQVNAYLVLFYGFYLLLLQNETFFNMNRLYLLCSASLSFIIPALHSAWVNELFFSSQVMESKLMINMILINPMIENNIQGSWTWVDWMVIIYFTVVAVLSFRFIWNLTRIISHSDTGETQAYSFFNKIFVSKSINSYQTIYKHELAHVRQLHSFDVILFELLSIVIWFNPVIYLYKKSARHIHEFIADEVACKEEPKAEYALLLLSNTLGVPASQLANNFFNQSLLKKRIIMLYKTKSRKAALLKYGFSAPLFIGMLLFSSAKIDDSSRQVIKDAAIPEPLATLEKMENLKINIAEKSAMQVQNVAGVDTTKQKGEIVSFEKLDKMADFPGGMKAFYSYIGKTFVLSPEAKKAKLNGKVIASFVVETDGSLTDIKILRDLGFGTGEEVVRVLKESPKWTPGIKSGNPVRVQYTLPVMVTVVGKANDTTSNRTSNTVNALSRNNSIVAVKDISSKQSGPAQPAEAASISVSDDRNENTLFVGSKNGTINIVSRDLSATGKKVTNEFSGLIIFNGKEQAKGFNINSIDPETIKSVNVLSGEATKAYGEKAKNGAIVITSK